jgi:hypothetical protein
MCKSLPKILAIQTQQHIKRTIHHDQLRFIPKMQQCLNMCKFINVMHNINRNDINYITIQMEVELFDKIQYP